MRARPRDPVTDDGSQARATITGAIQEANPFTDPESILDGVE